MAKQLVKMPNNQYFFTMRSDYPLSNIKTTSSIEGFKTSTTSFKNQLLFDFKTTMNNWGILWLSRCSLIHGCLTMCVSTIVGPRLIFWLVWGRYTLYTWYSNWYETGTRLVLPQIPTRLVQIKGWYCWYCLRSEADQNGRVLARDVDRPIYQTNTGLHWPLLSHQLA